MELNRWYPPLPALLLLLLLPLALLLLLLLLPPTPDGLKGSNERPGSSCIFSMYLSMISTHLLRPQ